MSLDSFPFPCFSRAIAELQCEGPEEFLLSVTLDKFKVLTDVHTLYPSWPTLASDSSADFGKFSFLSSFYF